MATSTASWFEWEWSQSTRREWRLANLRVSGRYLSSKQIFSTVVPCIDTHTDQQQHKIQFTKCAPQLQQVTHWWYFVSVEDKRQAATVVVQMPTVWLALGGSLCGRGSSHWTNSPLVAGCREACEVAVLQTLLSSRARLLSLIQTFRLEPTGTTTTDYLVSHSQTYM